MNHQEDKPCCPIETQCAAKGVVEPPPLYEETSIRLLLQKMNNNTTQEVGTRTRK